MPDHPIDPSIPTLTIQADPPAPDDDLPVLESIASEYSGALPPAPVLRAALHAEIEHAVQEALDEAMAHVRDKLEAELPAIVQRVMRTLRPG